MNKTVFFDIDGTLLNRHLEIPADALAAIAALRERGVKTAIATGRAGLEFHHFLERYPQAAGLFDMYIYSNGGLAVYQGKEVLRQPIPADEVAGMARICRENGLIHGFFDDHTVRMSVDTFPGVESFFGGNLVKTPHIKDPDYHQGRDIFAGFMVAQWDKAHLFAGFPTGIPVQGILAGGAMGHHLDFWCRNVSKATAIRQVVELLETDLQHTVVFGDGYNDIEMLEQAGIGVAMGNADPEVRAHADYVTAHIDEGGIAQGLRHLGLV